MTGSPEESVPLHGRGKRVEAPPRAPEEGDHFSAGEERRHTIVLGVNDNMYDAAKHKVISNASCTHSCRVLDLVKFVASKGL